jgi:hypothetical protein
MKPHNKLHKWMDRDGLETTVHTLRMLHSRAVRAMVQDPDLADFTASLELALQNAEKAFEQF